MTFTCIYVYLFVFITWTLFIFLHALEYPYYPIFFLEHLGISARSEKYDLSIMLFREKNFFFMNQKMCSLFRKTQYILTLRKQSDPQVECSQRSYK